MPEIRRQVPSESELREYFDLCLAQTTLPLLRTPIETARKLGIGLRDDSIAALLSLQSLGGDRFYELASQSLFQSLVRLNGLERTDPFWRNTNHRPTWFKLSEFCDRLLETDPNDELALWTLGSLQLMHGDNFGQSNWARLHALGHFELPWAVTAAYLVAGAARDCHAQLARFLVEQASPIGVLALLAPFRMYGRGDLPEWIEIVEAEVTAVE